MATTKISYALVKENDQLRQYELDQVQRSNKKAKGNEMLKVNMDETISVVETAEGEISTSKFRLTITTWEKVSYRDICSLDLMDEM